MRTKVLPAQYQLLSRYCEDISKAMVVSTVGGYFLPSVLPSATKPVITEMIAGAVLSLAFLIGAYILTGRVKNG